MDQSSALSSRLSMYSRCSQRISITVPYSILQALILRSNEEGRSVSNLSAFLLEQSLHFNDESPT